MYIISRFAGWDLRKSMSVPRYDGFVVCVEDAPILLDALKKTEAGEERRLERVHSKAKRIKKS